MRKRALSLALVPVLAAIAVFAVLRSTRDVQIAALEKAGLRVMTWNIAWFAEDSNAERLSNIRAVMNRVQPDIIALQEIQSRKALEQLFGDDWEIAIADRPNERQEVALVTRKPLRIIGYELIFEGRQFDDAFPGSRDVLRAVVETPAGNQISFYVIHMKSRHGGRMETDSHRIFGTALLAAYIRGMNEEFVVTLGDFNDTPDDESVNILESGDLRAKGGMAPADNPFMHNLTEEIWAKDYVTMELRDRFRGTDMIPRAEGARRENDRLRGVNYRFPDDVAVLQIMFDQILVSPKMNELFSGRIGIFAGVEALRGRPPNVQVESSGYVRYTDKGTLASDHLPVYADFRIP